MCGRVVQTTPVDELASMLGVDAVDQSARDLPPRRNIAPSADLVVLDQPDGAPTVTTARWGLIPHWAKDPSIGARLSNARSDTVWERPSFRDAIRRHRCLIPVDGFYEWAPASPDGPRNSAGRPVKRPHLFRRSDDNPILIAGIASERQESAGRLLTVCLLTTEANELMSPIHDRMPVIIESEMVDVWLHADRSEARELLDHLLAPAPTDVLTEYEVSAEVNNAQHEGPHLTEPVDEVPTTLF